MMLGLSHSSNALMIAYHIKWVTMEYARKFAADEKPRNRVDAIRNERQFTNARISMLTEYKFETPHH